ncbi:MAG: hypothetical protein ABSE63_03460 [Thermoguttaceae bacterium]
MDQQLRVSRWPCLAILACLLATYAILPLVQQPNAQQQAIDKVRNIDNTSYTVDVLPPVDEMDPPPLELGSLPEDVEVKPCAAILNEVSDSDVADGEGIDSISSEPSAPSTSSASETSVAEKEKGSEKEVVETTPAASGANSLPQSTAQQSPANAKPTPLVKESDRKESTTLVAHLPKPTIMPAETMKPGSLDVNYPNTGLKPLTLHGPAELEQSNSARKESTAWTEPAALMTLLEELGKAKESSGWAAETGRLVHELGPVITSDSDQAGTILDRLADSRLEALRLADSIPDLPIARKLRQASYAIERRLEVWREVERLGVSALVKADKPKVDSRRMSVCLAEIDNLMKTSAEGRQWRKYLLVDALKELSSQRSATESEAEQQRKVTQQVLARLTQTPMSAKQRQFIASEPMAAFCSELRHWAADPLTSADVLRDIERYEQTRLPSDAQQLGEDLRSLDQSSDPKRGELAGSVETHYRNANVRVSLTEDLLNRLVPQQKTEIAPVDDTVMGLAVRGQSRTSTDVALRLIPDPNRVRMAFEVTGEVAAMTSSTSGPATFFNDSDSLYSARKPFEIDQKGIKTMPAEVDVRHQMRLRDVTTDYDGIPLLGLVARSIARQQHEMARPQANQEARSKVANKARQRIDSEAHDRLEELVDNLNRKVFGPLVNLSLEPTMIEAQTTEQRMTMRLRVAGEDQLGSFTPRPQAQKNSLASFQIDESMLNNALQRLQLEGRTFTLPQLTERISERFQRPNTWQIAPENQDLTVTFAKKDAAALRCQEGRVMLTLNITKVSKEPRQWNNFQVRVFYRPQVNGRSAELVRDGVIQLICQRMSNGSQIALRGMFSKAFPQNDTIKLTPERFLADPKLQDLAITQFVIDDGWVGLGVGPKQFAVQMTQLPSLRR